MSEHIILDINQTKPFSPLVLPFCLGLYNDGYSTFSYITPLKQRRYITEWLGINVRIFLKYLAIKNYYK
jgi:hypothetical protein